MAPRDSGSATGPSWSLGGGARAATRGERSTLPSHSLHQCSKSLPWHPAPYFVGRDGKEEEKAQGSCPWGPKNSTRCPNKMQTCCCPPGYQTVSHGQVCSARQQTGDRATGEASRKKGRGLGHCMGHARSGQAEDFKLVHREVITAEEGSG